MSQPYVITRNTRADQDPPGAPAKSDGTAYDYAMRYNSGWSYCFADDVDVLVGVLCGDVDGYVAADEQARLVARIRASIGIQCWEQARRNMAAQLDGRWDKCTAPERAALGGSRVTQPSGWNAHLFDGVDWWLAPCDLVLIDTAFGLPGQPPMPMTAGTRLLTISPLTPEGWLDSLADLGAVDLFYAKG